MCIYKQLTPTFTTGFSVLLDKTQFRRHPFRKLFNNQQFQQTKLSFTATYNIIIISLNL